MAFLARALRQSNSRLSSCCPAMAAPAAGSPRPPPADPEAVGGAHVELPPNPEDALEVFVDGHAVSAMSTSDFGLANYYGAGRRHPLTSHVVTLWYRAPELLLGSTSYGVGIDLWSAGCVLAEMFFGKPLMPGSGEVDQLLKIFSLCGSPPDEYWRKMKLSPSLKPPKPYKSTMAERFRELPPSSHGLLATLLALDPAARGTAGQALQSIVRNLSNQANLVTSCLAPALVAPC